MTKFANKISTGNYSEQVSLTPSCIYMTLLAIARYTN